MSHAVALDHVGVVGRDVAVLAAEFETLGFCLTPLARHSGGRTGNRNVMLRRGYIELLSVVDGGSSATLDGFLARYAGIHIVALAITDADATLARLHRAGFAQAALSHTDRAVDDADPASMRARFTLITTPDRAEGRVHLIQHETPDALWQERFLQHPNHATVLEEVVLVVAEPAETAAWLSRLAGCPVVPDAAGGYMLDLPRGRVRMLPSAALEVAYPAAPGVAFPAALGAVFPDVAVPVLPWIAGVTLVTDDANAAVRRWLEEHAIPFWEMDDALLVRAGGLVLRFRAG